MTTVSFTLIRRTLLLLLYVGDIDPSRREMMWKSLEIFEEERANRHILAVGEKSPLSRAVFERCVFFRTNKNQIKNTYSTAVQ